MVVTVGNNLVSDGNGGWWDGYGQYIIPANPFPVNPYINPSYPYITVPYTAPNTATFTLEWPPKPVHCCPKCSKERK